MTESERAKEIVALTARLNMQDILISELREKLAKAEHDLAFYKKLIEVLKDVGFIKCTPEENARRDAERRAKVYEKALDLVLSESKEARCWHSRTMLTCDMNCGQCWESFFARQKDGYIRAAEKELAEKKGDEDAVRP